jgi:hypothetical protein
LCTHHAVQAQLACPEATCEAYRDIFTRRRWRAQGFSVRSSEQTVPAGSLSSFLSRGEGMMEGWVWPTVTGLAPDIIGGMHTSCESLHLERADRGAQRKPGHW